MNKKSETKFLIILLGLLLALTNIPAALLADGEDADVADADVAIDEDNFPDAIFRAYISEEFDTDGNGALSQAERNAVTAITVINRGISDLRGVAYFPNLTHLDCQLNHLTELDVSQLPKLKLLYCNNNQLSRLDVSQNPNLTDLNCSDNALGQLDVSQNPALIQLACDNNQLSSLVLGANSSLESLSCFNNSLSNLDLGPLMRLMTLQCYDNQLTQLDVHNSKELQRILCADNHLTSLDFSSLDNKAWKNFFFEGSGQTYAVEVSEDTLEFDLTSLPLGFDVAKSVNWNGGQVEGSTLTVDSSKPVSVTYDYQTGSTFYGEDKVLPVKLAITYIPSDSNTARDTARVSFDANGGSGSMMDVNVDMGATYTLPECGFDAPENQAFEAWEVNGRKMAVGDTIVVDADVIVKALWTQKQIEPPVEKVVRVTKDWNDQNNQAGLRPSSVTIRLLADGKDTGRTLVLTGENHWRGEFSDLERYDGSKRIVYTIVEDEVTGYESEIRGNDWSGFNVINSLVGTPSEPTEPSEPSEPSEPAEPSEPTEPTMPPTEPTEPTEPPTEPTEPTEPPTEPSAEEKHFITYDLAGGEIDGNPGPILIEAEVGDVITILEAPTREGFTFSYWKGSKYYPGDNYVVEGDHTFTAIWEEAMTEPSSQPSEEPTTPPTEPSKPENTRGTTQEQGLPQTGEDMQETLWLSAILVVAAGVLIILRRRLKKQDA